MSLKSTTRRRSRLPQANDSPVLESHGDQQSKTKSPQVDGHAAQLIDPLYGSISHGEGKNGPGS